MCNRLRIVAAMVLALLAGCGRSLPETAPVEGRVTLDGEPLATGTIMFVPDQGRPATGKIQPDGTYRLTTFATDDGALLGHHAVAIQASEAVGGEMPASFDEEIAHGQRAGQLRHIVPPRYNDRATSGLSAQVEAKPNRIDFELHK